MARDFSMMMEETRIGHAVEASRRPVCRDEQRIMRATATQQLAPEADTVVFTTNVPPYRRFCRSFDLTSLDGTVSGQPHSETPRQRHRRGARPAAGSRAHHRISSRHQEKPVPVSEKRAPTCSSTSVSRGCCRWPATTRSPAEGLVHVLVLGSRTYAFLDSSSWRRASNPRKAMYAAGTFVGTTTA